MGNPTMFDHFMEVAVSEKAKAEAAAAKIKEEAEEIVAMLPQYARKFDCGTVEWKVVFHFHKQEKTFSVSCNGRDIKVGLTYKHVDAIRDILRENKFDPLNDGNFYLKLKA